MRSLVCGLVVALVFAWGIAVAIPEEEGGAFGSFRPGSEPVGFGGHEWGSDLADMNGLTLAGCGIFGIREVCLYRNDSLTGGGVRVGYLFWKGRFFGVEIQARGPAWWVAMKEVAFEDFGDHPQADPDGVYGWAGEESLVFLQYSPDSGMASLTILSTRIGGEIHGRETGKSGAVMISRQWMQEYT